MDGTFPPMTEAERCEVITRREERAKSYALRAAFEAALADAMRNTSCVTERTQDNDNPR